MSGSEEDTRRQLMRWANGLPFGRAGFDFTRSTNDSSVAYLGTATLTWTEVVDDAENWMPSSGSTQTITVPPGLSGMYVFEYHVYWVASVAGVIPYVAVNGSTITSSDTYTSASTMASRNGLVMLNDGDTITAGFFNASGGALIPARGGGSGLEKVTPRLRMYRISLL